jgi:translation initiation factor 3 subunit B
MSDFDYYKSAAEDFEDIEEYLPSEPVEIDESQFPEFEPDFSSSIIVENVPAVSKEKIPKLMAVLMKIYGQISKITEADIHMPYNDDADMTYGFCFIKFLLKEEAENAIKVTQGLAIDKKHTFKVSMYSDLDHYANVADEYTEVAPQAFNPRPDPTSWLTDPSCRDQFVIRQAHETEIYWANHTGEEPNLVYGGEREKVGGKVWCESYVCWSPQGTYLATFHAPGIKLWGSTEFQSQGKFMHQKVEDLSFSPCENYIVTYRFTFNAQLDPAQAICVWDIRTGVLLRSFELKNPLDPKFQVQATVSIEEKGKKVEKVIRGRIASYEGDSNGGYFTIEEGNTIHERVSSDKVTPIQEPNRLKWSPDGKYLARLGADMISVYSLPSMTLLDKKSIAAKDVLDFVWSPRSNMISYWSPSVGNHPAMINIIRIPDRAEISSRKLFEVTDGRMVWQNDGEYLCVHMTKHQGKKKSYVLMFFRMKDAGVPVEQLELTEPILNTSWEPSGDRIVITYGEVRNPTIAFYSMSGIKGGAAAVVKSTTGAKGASAAPKSELTHLFTKTGVQCNDIFWSPAGGVVALAYFAPDACVFDLYDVENNVSLATRRHDRCTRLFWDPSGRFIASCTVSQIGSNARGHQDDGVNIYTFQGTLLCQMKKEKLVQFAWRPRPKDLLTPEEKKKVVKNLRKYEKSFEKEDRLRKQELHQEILAARHKQAEEFLGWMNSSRAINARLKARRVELRGGYDSDDERNYRVEVTVDEAIISSKEHPI